MSGYIELHERKSGAPVTIDVSRVYAVKRVTGENDSEHADIEFRNTEDIMHVSEAFEYVTEKLDEFGWVTKDD